MGLTPLIDDTSIPSPTTATKIAILVSGSGTNLQAFIDAWQPLQPLAELSLVISNRPQAAALARCSNAGITHSVIDHTQFETRAAFDQALSDTLTQSGIELVVLAGFMRILGDAFLTKWHGRVINIHPSLLPNYRGLNTHERVLLDACQYHGCTVHWVVPELDAGPSITQAKLAILPTDDAKSLQKRVQALEHLLYPLTLAYVTQKLKLPHDLKVAPSEAGCPVFDEQTLKHRWETWQHSGELCF